MRKGVGVTVRSRWGAQGLAGLLLGSLLVLDAGCSLVVRGILDDEGSPDGGLDASVDATPDGDTGMPDAMPEGGPDGGPIDAGPDGGMGTDGGPTDAGPDGGMGTDGGPADGGPDAEPPVYDSCATIRDVDPAASSGVYRIDPDGPGGAEPVEVFCDMDTEGGGWTLCAVATGTSGELASGEWGNPDPGDTGDWYACDRLVGGAGDDFMVVSAGFDSDTGLLAEYTDVFPGASLEERSPNTTGDVFLSIYQDRAPGDGAPVPGNAIWGLGNNAVPRFGIEALRNDCVSLRRAHRWSVYSLPTRRPGRGVLQREVMVPFVGYPCGDYGDRGVRMTLWHRPATVVEPLPRDCADIQAGNPGAPSGFYAIDPDGWGGEPPVTVRCDMETAGGGWTLCAAAVGAAELALPDWNSDEMDALWPTDWFACDRLMFGDGTEQIMVRSRSAIDFGMYEDVFSGAGYNTTVLDDATGQVQLRIWQNTDVCGVEAPGNRGWFLFSSEQARYGLLLTDFRVGRGCAGMVAGWFLNALGTEAGVGCLGADQVVPFISYPCGSYGDYGARMEMWYRPMRSFGP